VAKKETRTKGETAMEIFVGSMISLLSVYGGLILGIAHEARRLGINHSIIREWVGEKYGWPFS